MEAPETARVPRVNGFLTTKRLAHLDSCGSLGIDHRGSTRVYAEKHKVWNWSLFWAKVDQE